MKETINSGNRMRCFPSSSCVEWILRLPASCEAEVRCDSKTVVLGKTLYSATYTNFEFQIKEPGGMVVETHRAAL